MLNVGEIKARLAELGQGPAQWWGQNFLIAEGVQRQIIKAATNGGILPQVLEIGPGLGVLTADLLTATAALDGQVVAVERDPVLAAALPAGLHHPKNLKVVPADVVKFNVDAWFKDGEYDLVTNLPFQVSNFVLWRYLTELPRPRRLTIMLQKEVADRLLAKPGGKTRAPLSVLAELYTDGKVICQVPSTAFWPAPKVTATVVQLTIKKPIEGEDYTLYRLVKAGFQNRRKTLENNLAAVAGGKDGARDLLKRSNIDPAARAESLSLAEWQVCSSNCNLSSAITEAKK
jgi:16S rRNA (adenine1518-N6/adenine1519-N6)-dimethyltransferase